MIFTAFCIGGLVFLALLVLLDILEVYKLRKENEFLREKNSILVALYIEKLRSTRKDKNHE
ncbi:hypothetical protein CKC_05865 [Candidatus Liberibacter solanacearum CLso-ZC1]|uniref:Uncharacterized protein n=1 Tax=Liberibacter solanacearum (strain CLso-ZC1) TaxID=658172 RepID=E4UC61_LIBSC|nr:hypothetical protein CKC_01000 [Candidatus Liberibacter solanacearum CLso-ZC1]ADR52918.1 hypothetical protein CKC_05865 [Candidatus Liberibacter solanacearum CLso-ZC1]